MPSESNSAILSLYVYQASLNNQPLLADWTLLQPRTEGTGGFAYAVFRNEGTNEIVIAYRGTDDVSDMLTNTGLTIAQERQAAVIAAQYIRQFGAENVSFTGYSMGGGLAATMAVWFNRPAVVFDPAPTQAVATDAAVVNRESGESGSDPHYHDAKPTLASSSWPVSHV